MALSASEAQLSSSQALDIAIGQIILDAGLGIRSNAFFQSARTVTAIDACSALYIAFNWRQITKTFMFSTIAGLGEIARAQLATEEPAPNALGVLQTGIRVIADDLDNAAPIFAAKAPSGIDGIHYRWWQTTILQPIVARAPGQVSAACRISCATESLANFMRDEAIAPIGAAVQLRIVEAIARDIAIAFRRIFSRLEIDGEKLFPGREDLAWIDTHIKAEVGHASDVCRIDSGMAWLAVTSGQQQELLATSRRYASLWNDVLKDFANALINPRGHHES